MKKLIFLFLLMSAFSFAAQETPSKQNQIPVTVQAQKSSEADRLNKVETTVSVIRDYNGTFMSVIIWSLSTVGTIAFALIGFSWFTNIRMIQRDIQTLRDELIAILGEKAAEAQQINSENMSLKSKEILEITTSAAEKMSNAATAQIKSQISNAIKRIGELEYLNIKKDIILWNEKHVYANSCSAASELLEKSLTLNSDYYVEESIDILRDSLEKMEHDNEIADAATVRQLEGTINKLGADLKTSKLALLSQLIRISSRPTGA
ncbi:hypothetical protein GETHLI_35880 [Geothrix limicola]|uniref:Uncharacterized protein n=1 Tax=Geothrix limicola TaxID=2927978 RepID=A0ABQ5QJN1_9BACT|nr:hypothetical protein [Geothrix limicola]GLH75085.1 hypothetical protein GETHLI_35880 [Geothrix limicola]